MEQLKIKHKMFDVLKEVDENTLSLSLKDKQYYCYKFPPHTREFDNALYLLKRISTSGVTSPKLKFVDKKQGYIVRTAIEGQSIFEILVDENLSDEIYSQIFAMAWLAKSQKMVLDFSPDKWIYSNKKLYYIGKKFDVYSEKVDFANHGVRLWFFTPDFVNFAKEKGIKCNTSRMKPSFDLNKEIVLTACKFYR